MGCKQSSPTTSVPTERRPISSSSKKDQTSLPVIRHASPSKSKKSTIPISISTDEVQKFKAHDIFLFIKEGNLQMVHNLFHYFQIRDVEQLTGYKEVISAETVTYNTEEWNPLLYAIAHKKPEIVDYFLNQTKSSIKQAGTFPKGSIKVEDELFCLFMAMKFDAYDSMKLLWNNHLTWDVIHFELLIQQAIQENDSTAMNILFDSYTSDLIFSSISPDHQNQIIKTIFDDCKQNQEMLTQIGSSLALKPFAIPTLIQACKHDCFDIASSALENIEFYNYGHIQDSESLPAELKSQANQLIATEKQSVKDLGEKIKAKLTSLQDSMIGTIFGTPSKMQEFNEKLLLAFKAGERDEILQLISEGDLRRLPYFPGETKELQGFNMISNTYETCLWTPAHFLMMSDFVPENEKILILNDIASVGLNLRQVFRAIPQQKVSHAQFIDEIYDGVIAMLIPILKKQPVLLNFFFSVHFGEIWTFKQINHIQEILEQQSDTHELIKFLDSHLIKHLFNGLEEQQKYPFLEKFARFPGIDEEEIDDVLKKQPFSPYYMLYLSNRQVFRHLESMNTFRFTARSLKDYQIDKLLKREGNVKRFEQLWKFKAVLAFDDPQSEAIDEFLAHIQSFGYFANYKDEASNVMDDYSTIEEEPTNECKVGNSNIKSDASLKLDVAALKEAFDQGNQDEVISILEKSRIQNIYILSQLLQFEQPFQYFNIAQICVVKGYAKILKFLLNEFTVANYYKGRDHIHYKILLLSDIETQKILELLLKNMLIFKEIWANSAKRENIWASTNLKYVVDTLIENVDTDNLAWLVSQRETLYLISQLNFEQRVGMKKVIEEYQANAHESETNSIIGMALQNSLFFERDDERRDIRVISAIKEGNVDYIIQDTQTVFSTVYGDTTAQDLKNDKIELDGVPELNAIQFAIVFGQQDILKNLTQGKSDRSIFQGRLESVEVKHLSKTYHFTNPSLALVFKTQKPEILNRLVQNSGFLLKHDDIKSFVDLALHLRWFSGLKIFMTASSTHFSFNSLSFLKQADIIESILNHDQVKNDDSSQRILLNEFLVKRPYTKHLLVKLITNAKVFNTKGADIAQACLKQMGTEDLQMVVFNNQTLVARNMKSFKSGNETIDSEIMKIFNRIRSEVLNE